MVETDEANGSAGAFLAPGEDLYGAQESDEDVLFFDDAAERLFGLGIDEEDEMEEKSNGNNSSDASSASPMEHKQQRYKLTGYSHI